MVTDYDCWREGEEPVTAEMVMNTMKVNSANLENLIKKCVPALAQKDWSSVIEANKVGYYSQ